MAKRPFLKAFHHTAEEEEEDSCRDTLPAKRLLHRGKMFSAHLHEEGPEGLLRDQLSISPGQTESRLIETPVATYIK